MMDLKPPNEDPFARIAFCIEALDRRVTELEELLHVALDHMPEDLARRLKATSEATSSTRNILLLHDLIDQVIDLKQRVEREQVPAEPGPAGGVASGCPGFPGEEARSARS